MAEYITNTAKLTYEYLDETYTEEVSCDLMKGDVIKPVVMLAKTGSIASVDIGDTVTYYLTATVGAGYDGFDSAVLEDTPDECTDFVEGTLKVNGEIAEVQDLSAITIALTPNAVYQIEYQCIRARY